MAKGDHLYVNCGAYDHHGIDCGDETVIHYEGKYRGGRITRVPKMTFANGKIIHVRQYSEKTGAVALADGKTAILLSSILAMLMLIVIGDIFYAGILVIF